MKYQPSFPRKSIPTTTETEVPTARVKSFALIKKQDYLIV